MFDRILNLLIEKGQVQQKFPFAPDDNKEFIRRIRAAGANLNARINKRKGGPTTPKNQKMLFKLESANRNPKRVAAANEKYRKARQGSGQVEGKPNFITTKEGEKARRSQKEKNDLPFQAERN